MPPCLRAGFDKFVHVQRNRFHGKRQYLFIESICNDPDILQQNYRYKMMYSPDYKSTEADKVTFLNYAERSFDTAGIELEHTRGAACMLLARQMSCVLCE